MEARLNGRLEYARHAIASVLGDRRKKFARAGLTRRGSETDGLRRHAGMRERDGLRKDLAVFLEARSKESSAANAH